MSESDAVGAAAEAGESSPSWTTRNLLRWMIEFFEARSIDSPRLTAELLLSYVLNCERVRLYMEVDRPATIGERDALRAMVRRVAANEPVQYLLGHAPFYGRTFEVSRATLIPRWCTETLIEQCVTWARRMPAPLRILEIGTGTGCIAVTLALELPPATMVATDVAEDVLELAARNAASHGVADRIEFRVGSFYEPLGPDDANAFDAIVSNPPYIPDHEWESAVSANVKGHEPERALRGGVDGLSVIRPLLVEAGQWLTPRSAMFVEIAESNGDEVLSLAQAQPWCRGDARLVKDGEGRPRVLCAESFRG